MPMSFGVRRTFYARRRRILGNSHDTHDTATPTFAHLAPCFFLVHYAISTLQIYRTRHLYDAELDTMRPHLILSTYALPLSFPSHSFTCHVEQFHFIHLLISIPRIFHFNFLFLIFCKLDFCMIYTLCIVSWYNASCRGYLE